MNHTIVAVDNSESTTYVPNYCDYVNNIIKHADNPRVILWSSRRPKIHNKLRLSYSMCDSGTTLLKPCLKLLQTLDFDTLILITDGRIEDREECQRFWKNEKSIRVEIHLIGYECNMDLQISTIFKNQTLYINEKEKCHVHYDIQDITFENLNAAKAAIIASIDRLRPKEKNLLLIKLQKYTNERLNQLSDPATGFFSEKINNLYRQNNFLECASIVKNSYGSFIHDKKSFQQQVQLIENILRGKEQNVFSLQHLKPVPKVNLTLEAEEENVETTDLECDILYEKCNHVCLLVRKPSRPLLTKKIKNPFNLLEDVSVTLDFINCVEYNKIDFTSTFKQLSLKSQHLESLDSSLELSHSDSRLESSNLISPFTRQALKGVFVLHNGPVDIWKLINYNAKTLTILYGDGLPGNRALWCIVFLYLMATQHPAWKNHQTLLFDEIRYIAENVTTFITLNPLIHPNIKVKMNVAFWYVANVSPIAFPNSEKNILRVLGKPFYDFYSHVYSRPESVSKQLFDTWIVWKWMIHQQDVEDQVKTQFQNYKEIKKGRFVYLEGPGKPHGFLKDFDPKAIMIAYNNLSQKESTYQQLDDTLPNKFKVVPLCNDETEFEASERELNHITINIRTGHPFVLCLKTKKHWKLCAMPMKDVKKESLVRLFSRYCIRYNCYPETPDDLWLYHSDMFPSTVYNEKMSTMEFSKVFEMYDAVRKTMDCASFIKLYNKYQSEKKKLEME